MVTFEELQRSKAYVKQNVNMIQISHALRKPEVHDQMPRCKHKAKLEKLQNTLHFMQDRLSHMWNKMLVE